MHNLPVMGPSMMAPMLPIPLTKLVTPAPLPLPYFSPKENINENNIISMMGLHTNSHCDGPS